MNTRRTQDGNMFILQSTNKVVNKREGVPGHPAKRVT